MESFSGDVPALAAVVNAYSELGFSDLIFLPSPFSTGAIDMIREAVAIAR